MVSPTATVAPSAANISSSMDTSLPSVPDTLRMLRSSPTFEANPLKLPTPDIDRLNASVRIQLALKGVARTLPNIAKNVVNNPPVLNLTSSTPFYAKPPGPKPSQL
mmetsp:Transcript_3385/g.6498  ORF Transcript_3385/g.6498 Transcript_3385/m.6498 type:complete len:106 (+) Transcript_3385:980-1297(+)